MAPQTMPLDRTESPAGADEAAVLTFDPFELEDTVSGNIRDPYPADGRTAGRVPGPRRARSTSGTAPTRSTRPNPSR